VIVGAGGNWHLARHHAMKRTPVLAATAMLPRDAQRPPAADSASMSAGDASRWCAVVAQPNDIAALTAIYNW
jgi:hypothetical protein